MRVAERETGARYDNQGWCRAPSAEVTGHRNAGDFCAHPIPQREHGTRRARGLVRIVAEYEQYYRDGAREELQFFARQETLELAVDLGGRAEGPHGKLRHQHRIPVDVLEKSARRLRARIETLRCCRDFEELIAAVDAAIRPIRGIGELTVYDTALRVGARLDLAPKAVYLHAGTRKGARALGLNVRRPTIPLSDLPGPLRRLRPHEIEDVLCGYKDKLNRVSRRVQ